MSRLVCPPLAILALLTACGDSSAPDTTRRLAAHEGNAQSATVGQAVAVAPAVRVTNGSGAGVSGVAIEFVVASGGGTVAGATATTDGTGVARVGSWTLGPVSGPNTLTARISGGADSTSFTATGTADAPVAAERAAADDQAVNTRTAVPAAPAVKLTDRFGNPVPGVTVTFAVAEGGGTVTGATPATGADGVATVGSWVLGASPGVNRLTATAAGAGIANNPVTFTATGREVVLQPAQDTALQAGTLRVNRLIIAAGRTVTVSGDLVIDADSVVTIAGTLRGNCVALTLDGKQSVTVSGTIDNACANQPATPPALTIVAKGGYDLSAATLRTTGDVDITNDPTLTDADFAPGPSPAARTVAARLAAGTICGVNGLTAPAAANGSPGTTGGPGRPGRTWTLRCRGDLSIGGTVAGQDGGHGGKGTDTQAGAANATGGRGGDGGKLVVKATGIVALGPGSTLRSGRGGDGGDADAIAQESDLGDTAPSATATGGRGGDPGLIEVRGKDGIQVSGSARFELGAGGAGGDASATGADGKDATAAKAAQHGGAATATGGLGGALDADQLKAFGNILGGPIVAGGDGGAGGTATAKAGTGGDSQIEAFPNGGNGGRFKGTGGDGGNAEARDLQGLRFGSGGDGGAVALSGGNGGTGWDDCGNPKKAGGRGGDGGSADGGDGKGGTGVPNGAAGGVTITDAGNGGQGGDGEPVGTGGAAGAETALTVRSGAPVKVGKTFQAGPPGLPCGIPAGKGAVRVTSQGLPASGVPAVLGLIKQGATTVAEVTTATQTLILDPGNYVFEGVTVDPNGYQYRVAACLAAGPAGAPGPARADGQPCAFTILEQQIYFLTLTWLALRAQVTLALAGLPSTAVVDVTFLLCQVLSPCQGPSTIFQAPGILYVLAGAYQLLGAQSLAANLQELETYRPVTSPQALTAAAGAALQVTLLYYLAQSRGFFDATTQVKSDPHNHVGFINLWVRAIVTLLRAFTAPAAVAGVDAAAQAGVQVTLSGPAPWVPVTGTFAADSTIVATGTGTVAGFPNVPVRFTGKLNPNGTLTGDYQMGQDTQPTGLPGGSIVYSVSGVKVNPPPGAIPPAAVKGPLRSRRGGP